MVDKFMAWLKNLPKKFSDWWEKFTPRQKTAIVCLALGVIAAFSILFVVLVQPQYVEIYTAASAKDAQEAIDLLTENNMDYQTSQDGLTILINKKDYTNASLLLGSNDIYIDSYSIENVTTGGFSTTEADKQKRYIVYLEDMMSSSLESYSFVKTATVQLNIPEDDGTLIAQNTESYASVLLELSDVCTTDAAAAMARFVATALGNDTTENVVILDTEGTLLFSGTDESSTYGTANSQLALTEQVANAMKNDVTSVLLATNQFSAIEVAAKVELDNSYSEYSEHLYWPDEGKEQGVLASSNTYENESTGGTSGVPGTDSNTEPETTYVYEDGEYTNSSSREESLDYLPNESTLLQQIPAGAIKYDQSSITVTCLIYKIQKEDDIEDQGLLDGISWDQYKLSNDIRTKVDVDTDLYRAVSTATGIAENNITIIAYEEPFFVDHEGLDVDVADVLQIILIVVILGLLAFVVIRSMQNAKMEEEETEISIDEILKSTPPEELEEIAIEDKSEARKIVEKFVEDNPDAAANLLRNWLSEDWG